MLSFSKNFKDLVSFSFNSIFALVLHSKSNAFFVISKALGFISQAIRFLFNNFASIAVVHHQIIGSSSKSHSSEYLKIKFLTTSGDQFQRYLLLCVAHFQRREKDRTVDVSNSKSFGCSILVICAKCKIYKIIFYNNFYFEVGSQR
ncbi:MAG: hypothetical protein BWY04_00083 [candidate division CPR1 bacterium ADurb.Bin160]|uniref:Uncharacterized protein n=1 Tax=candidate division CPR1 bacterium ADurb.Bin160 TaxID=1852826 RepID=A0A1V5ZR24_9BACT|nr:MAG: hypothetical protein BWY04_00083 [candidate division CPR1 bacterium ADurb.Bin160]